MYSISNDYPKTLAAEWVLSNVCNYECSYCTPTLNDGSSGWPDVDVAKEFWNFVHTDINPNDKMLTLTGGEPTLWPKLTEFFNGLHPSWYTAIVTNGSRTIRWWKKFLKDCNNIHRVTISLHLEFADIDHIVEVCKLLGNRVQLTVLIMFKDTKYAKQVAEKLKENKVNASVFVKPIIDRSVISSIEYRKKDLNFMKNFKMNQTRTSQMDIPVSAHLYIDGKWTAIEHAHEMITNKTNDFRGWRCEIGSKRLLVWHDGTVYGAQCGTAKKNPLGNIKDKKIKKITNIVCDTPHCNCVPDLRIPKWKEDVSV
tara:strand:- start:1455 stop:2387 length:933 start_codon:yes stop_codon:yes gene_type:complete